MSVAKIRLSQKETELVSNADLILTKNSILQKVNQLLANLQVQQQQFVQQHASALPAVIRTSSPKISKGENYRGLPYLILDYPRSFGKTDTLAARTMFWWGNFMNVTLHLSGIHLEDAQDKLISAYPVLKESGYYCSVNEDPWEHHFEPGNYILLKEMGPEAFQKSVKEGSFIKLSRKMELRDWDDAEEILMGYFEQLIGVLAD